MTQEDMFDFMYEPGFLCKYKDIFGYPRIGAHAIRIPIIDIAFVDTLLTVILAWFIYKQYDYKSFWNVFIVLILIGIVIHHMFCVKTRLNEFLFK